MPEKAAGSLWTVDGSGAISSEMAQLMGMPRRNASLLAPALDGSPVGGDRVLVSRRPARVLDEVPSRPVTTRQRGLPGGVDGGSALRI